MKVTIEKGFLGSYNLTIEGRNGLIKVSRIKRARGDAAGTRVRAEPPDPATKRAGAAGLPEARLFERRCAVSGPLPVQRFEPELVRNIVLRRPGVSRREDLACRAAIDDAGEERPGDRVAHLEAAASPVPRP